MSITLLCRPRAQNRKNFSHRLEGRLLQRSTSDEHHDNTQ